MARVKDDAVLRIFNEVLCLERLHYGLWLPEEAISFEQLKVAQKRYEDFLIGKIPSEVKRILDVGCGTGVMAAHLRELDFDVEGLSPDVNQQKLIEKTGIIRLHSCCFEDFATQDRYDCIVMSESSQYIRLRSLFKVAAESLRKNGYLLICDYFVLNNVSGSLGKSGHGLDEFMDKAKSEGFAVLEEQDITNEVVRTLEMANLYAERSIRALEIYVEKLEKSHPYLVRLTLWLLRNKIKTWRGQLDLLDSNKFKESKAYKLLLFRLEG